MVTSHEHTGSRYNCDYNDGEGDIVTTIIMRITCMMSNAHQRYLILDSPIRKSHRINIL